MTAINAVTDYTVEDGIGVVTLNSPPVNALGSQAREGLREAFKNAVVDPSAAAIVLICEGRTFIAGADIKEFSGDAPAQGRFHEAQDAIEFSPKPVVAAIHGSALGGGLEVALLCHYRVAVPSARCGLPEVNLGLLPGGGGTQRLPRLVGVETALELITSGRHVPAPECRELGLLDALAPEGELRGGAIAFARNVVAERRPLRPLRDDDSRIRPARPEIFAAFREANAARFRGFNAPESTIRCIEAAVNAASFEDGLAVERALFLERLHDAQSAAQRYYFFAERQARKLAEGAMEAVTAQMRARLDRELAALLQAGATPSAVRRALEDFGFRDLHDLPGEGRSSAGASLVADADIRDRCVHALIDEGARVLEAGGAISPSGVDVACVRGLGWPVYRGGPMHHADRLGLDAVLARMMALQAAWGDEPSTLLRELAAAGKTLSDL